MKHIHLACLFTLCVLSAACGAGPSQQAAAPTTDAASIESAAKLHASAGTTKPVDTPPATTKAVSTMDTSAQQSIPTELKAFVSPDMKLLVYKTTGTINGSDAIAVLEKQKKSATDPDVIPRQRLLLLFRNENGALKEIARSDKIIACSTCGEDMDDPFIPDGVILKPGHLTIEQDHGTAPSNALYKFIRDPQSQQWIVSNATNTHVEQSPVAGDFIKTPHELQLPNPPLLTSFDPDWRTPQSWNAVVVNDKTHEFSLPRGEADEQSLDKSIKEECQTRGVCHVLLKQLYGCVSLVQDPRGNSFAGASLDRKNGRLGAERGAMQACAQHGIGDCKVAAFTGCSSGYK